jgi:predicted nucleic acid-binding protein
MGITSCARYYDRVLVPTIVTQELYRGEFLSWNAYKQHYGIHYLIEVIYPISNKILCTLHQVFESEKQAIDLAYGHNLPHNLPLLIEEEKGRNVPQNLGLQILGTAGQILKAYPQEIIEVVEVKQKLQELLQAGRIGRTIYIALIATI